MDWIFNAENWAALVTLTLLEIVLGIDNIVFISILAGKLPSSRRTHARTGGLALAMGTRILLLLSLTWIMRLTTPLFSFLGRGISGRELILLAGGVFLIWKSGHEIGQRLKGEPSPQRTAREAATMSGVLVQIALIDIVFSLDSVITAVGMANQIGIMIAAIVLAVGFMMFASGPLSAFVERYPTVKMLALSFLLLVGGALVIEGLDLPVTRDYVYFAMGFALFVELLNLRAAKVSQRKLQA